MGGWVGGWEEEAYVVDRRGLDHDLEGTDQVDTRVGG